MKSKNPYEKIKQIRCVACGAPVMVDQWGQGRCENCNWRQGEDNLEHPDLVAYPNLVSLNRARLLTSEGKPLKPTIDEFIEAYEQYGEMEFDYDGRHYGIITLDDGIKLYEKNVKGSIQSFTTTNEFREEAHIGGMLLKDIWNDVENAGYMST